MAHVTAAEYRTIASHVTPECIHLNGTTVPLLPENSLQVAAAVSGLLKQIEPKAPQHSPMKFDSALKRCRHVAEMLRELDPPLDPQQRMDLADAVAKVRIAAAGLGVVLIDRR